MKFSSDLMCVATAGTNMLHLFVFSVPSLDSCPHNRDNNPDCLEELSDNCLEN